MFHTSIFLVVVLLYCVNALVCPSDYTSGQDDLCYRVFSDHSGYSDASFQCTSDGGRLASIHNAYTNNAVHDLAKAANTIVWLGLRCIDSNPANCKWDDGQGAPYPYNAFYPGNPSGIGECVLLMVGGNADGQWISGDCDKMQVGFVCQVAAKAACGNYQEFNGSCFQAYNDLPSSYSAAELFCQSECGNLVSIHSANENDFVYNLLGHTANYARLGLKRSGNSYVWTDTTKFDYNNVGYSNPAFGDCMAMSLIDELVVHGEWISVACEQALPFVCKRDGDCVRSTTVVPPTPATLAPPTCDAPVFMDTNGTLYSPGYPTSYRSTKVCYYVMTVAADQQVELYFVDLQLSSGSSIQIFNSIADSKPFATITANTTLRYFISTTNVMKMTFIAGNDVAGVNRWEAIFGPGSKVKSELRYDGYQFTSIFGHYFATGLKLAVISTTPPVTITPSPTNPSGCNQNSIVPANIASPNYPNNYPALTQCHYQLSTDFGHKIRLTFGAIDTEQCCDIIDVYDYDGTPYYPLLDRFSGQIAAGVKNFTSTMNQMFVDFYSDSLGQRKGFTAVAIRV